MTRPTSSTLNTETLARILRVGNEHSSQNQKLRAATDALLSWLKDNARDITLPDYCQISPSGEFQQAELSHPPHGSHVPILKLSIGGNHSVADMHQFARLIAGGWLEKVCDLLGERAENFAKAAGAIRLFLAQTGSTRSEPSTLTQLPALRYTSHVEVESVANWILYADSDPNERPWKQQFGKRYCTRNVDAALDAWCIPLVDRIPHLYRTSVAATWSVEFLRDALDYRGPDSELLSIFVRRGLVWMMEEVIYMLAHTMHDETSDPLGLRQIADNEAVFIPIYAPTKTFAAALSNHDGETIGENLMWLRLKLDHQLVVGRRPWSLRALEQLVWDMKHSVQNSAMFKPKHRSLILFRGNPRSNENA